MGREGRRETAATCCSSSELKANGDDDGGCTAAAAGVSPAIIGVSDENFFTSARRAIAIREGMGTTALDLHATPTPVVMMSGSERSQLLLSFLAVPNRPTTYRVFSFRRYTQPLNVNILFSPLCLPIYYGAI